MNEQEKGIYLLIIRLKKDKELSVGKKQTLNFQKGIYIYIGRASRGLRGRINRHLRKDKKLFWHIDYLLQEAEIEEVWTKPGDFNECQTAREMRNFIKNPDIPLKKFGSSDCHCPSHLFYLPENYSQLENIRKHFSFKKILINGNQI